MGTLSVQMQPFFEWLLRSTVQAGLVVCLILLLQAVFRNRLGVRWHHALWLILVVRMVLPWAPQSRWSVFNVMAAWDGPHENHSSMAEPSGQSSTTSDTGPLARQPAGSEVATSSDRSDDRVYAVQTSPSRLKAVLQTPARGARDLLPLLWAVGALALGTYVAASNLKLWRAISIEHPSTDKDVLELLEECRAQMGLRTLVALVTSAQVNTPVLLGFIRPRLLIPKDIATQLSPEELRYVFLHELAHVKRHDIALAWLTALLQVLHWFNPLIWLAFHRMRVDRELACDALVLTRTQGEGTKDYGRAIVSLLERFSFPPPLPGLAGILENKSQLKRRIAMITQFQNNSYRWSVAGIGLIAVLGAVSMIDPTRGAASSGPASQAKPAVTMRSVEQDANVYSYVGVSPDGRYLCGYDTWRARGEIVIREVATGEEHIIRPTKETPQEGGPRCPVMSPDNTTIAYLVERPGATDDNLQSADVRLIGADGSGQRVLCRGAVSGGRVVRLAPKPIQWFPDGNRLLALGWPDRIHASNSIEIVSVSIEDGAVQVIKKLTGDFARTRIRLSPDGEYVAYELPSQDAPENHDIFALELDSNQETLLVGHAANDRLLDWTPDGRHILFSSERLGRGSVWLLPVTQGRAHGTPKLVVQSAGNMGPVGFAQNGSYFYFVAAGTGDIYTAGINVTTGQLLSPPAPLEAGGYNMVADWSPDGKYLAYGSRPRTARAPGSQPGVIRIRSLATGAERELAKPPAPFNCLRWAPDGRSLLVSGMRVYNPEDIALTRRVYRIDAATGETTLLLEHKVEDWWVMWAELSPDGKTLYYYQAGIVRRELDTGQQKTILPFRSDAKGPWVGWALSPNGEFVATGVNEGTGQKGPEGAPEGGVKKVLLIPSQGGQATELVRWDQEPADYLTHTCWSPDGKTLLFTLHRVPAAGKNAKGIDEFWQVSIDGGEPRKIMETDLGMDTRCGFRVHPDGQRIAFSARAGYGGLWVMENFLPASPGAKESR